MSGENQATLSAEKILGYNLAVLVAYTICCRLADHNFILQAFCIVGHIVYCLTKIDSPSKKNKAWWLSIAMILLLGFTGCVYIVAATNDTM